MSPSELPVKALHGFSKHLLGAAIVGASIAELSACGATRAAGAPSEPKTTSDPERVASDRSRDATCSSLAQYKEAAQTITSFPTFGAQRTVLIRPSRDAKRLEDAATFLKRADAANTHPASTTQEVSGLLHGQLESLQRLFTALEHRNKDAYTVEAGRYGEQRLQLARLGSGLDEQCGARVFRSESRGSIPPELIQKTIRQHYDELRHCYEAGLARNSELTGRVTVRFVIGRTGQVQEAAAVDNASSDGLVAEKGTEEFFAALGLSTPTVPAEPATTLPDVDAVRCMVERFRGLQFPAPENGIVTVVYPVKFEPKRDTQK